MAKKDDIRKYWQEWIKEAGLTDEQAKPILDTLGNDAAAEAFTKHFVAVPDHHRTVDKVKAEALETGKTEARATYDKWYNEQALPAYEANKKGVDKLNRYIQEYGDIDATTEPHKPQTPSFTRDDMEKLINERLAARDSNYVSLTKDAMRVAVQHYKDFGEVIDPDDLEKYAVKSGRPLREAYESYVRPRVEEKNAKEVEEKIKKAREEGARDALSRHKLPVSETPRDFHPLYDQKPAAKDVNPDTQSRNAFMDQWNKWADDVASNHK